MKDIREVCQGLMISVHRLHDKLTASVIVESVSNIACTAHPCVTAEETAEAVVAYQCTEDESEDTSSPATTESSKAAISSEHPREEIVCLIVVRNVSK